VNTVQENITPRFREVPPAPPGLGGGAPPSFS